MKKRVAASSDANDGEPVQLPQLMPAESVPQQDKSTMRMSSRSSWRFGTCLAFCIIGAGSASAQIKPASSGEPSFREPEMKRNGQGLYHPNVPPRHRSGHLRRGRAVQPF